MTETDTTPPSDERVLERIARSGIPPVYRGRRLVDLMGWPGGALLAANGWVQQGGVLFLHGPNGTGKTTLAAAALLGRLERRPGGRFIDAQELGSLASADFGSGDVEAAHRIASAKGPLVLDDLGQERHTAQVAEIVKRAIRTRLDHDAPLIITSNFTVPELAERQHYGAWLGSRLAHHGRVVQLRLNGPDHRLDRP